MPCTVCIPTYVQIQYQRADIPIPFQPSSRPPPPPPPPSPFLHGRHVGQILLRRCRPPLPPTRIMNIQPDDRPIAIASFPSPHPKRRKKTVQQNRHDRPEANNKRKTAGIRQDTTTTTTRSEPKKRKSKFGRHNNRPAIPSHNNPHSHRTQASPAPRKEITTKRNTLSPTLLLHLISYTSKIVCTGVWTCAACAACACTCA